MSERVAPGRQPSILAKLPFYYGWVVVAVAFVTMAIGVNARTAFSLIFPSILDEFGWQRGETAAAFSIGFLAAALYAPFLGMAMDRFGLRLVMPAGALLMGAGFALATFSSQVWHFYLTLGVLVVGASITLSYIGHSMFLTNWFNRRRGLAAGIAFAGVGIGSIVLFPWLESIIAGHDWRYACWVLAALMFVIVLPLNFFLQRQRPEDLGLRPDGAEVGAARDDANASASNVVDQAWVAVEWTLPRAMRTARFWWLFVGFGAGLYTWYAIQVHQTKYLIEIDFSPETAAVALGLVGFSGVVGQIWLGHLSDRVGREWVWSLSALGFAACCLLLILMQHQPSSLLLYTMVVTQGLLGYGMASVYAAIAADIFQGRRLATIYGVLSLSASAGAALGPWVSGVIYDATGSYVLAFLLMVILSLFSILCVWRTAPRKVRVVAGQVGKLRED